MSWLDRLRPKMAPTVSMADSVDALSRKFDTTRPMSLTGPNRWDVEPSWTGEHVNERTVLALSAVWACVNLLAGTIASLPLMVYRTDANGARQVASDHPLYRLLHDSPNADQTALEFWEGGATAIELRGNMHARKTLDRGRLVALTPIYAEVTPRRERSGDIRYAWTEDGRPYDLGQDEVFHVRGFGGTPLAGLSTLSYGRNTFGFARAVNRASASTFANGLRPSGVMTFAQFLKPEQRNDVENALQEKFAGAMQAGRPMVLEGGQTWQSLGINPVDAQMLETMGFSVEEVCRLFGVPPFMVGRTEKTTSWGTGLRDQIQGFQKFALRRRLKRIEQAIAKQLLTPADRVAGITVEFNLEGLLRGDSDARSAFYQSALMNGWMTINEVRALENLPPVEGGEVPRMQSQNTPISQVPAVGAAAKPPTPPVPEEDA